MMSYAKIIKGGPGSGVYERHSPGKDLSNAAASATAKAMASGSVEYHRAASDAHRAAAKHYEANPKTLSFGKAGDVGGKEHHTRAANYHADLVSRSENSGESRAGLARGRSQVAFYRRGKMEKDSSFGKFMQILKGGPGSGVYERHKKPTAEAPAAARDPKGLPAGLAREKVQAMHDYMNGFHKNLTRENERSYAVDRSRQLIEGTPRQSGMSAKYDMTKQRAAQYEALVYKIFLAGRAKHGV